VIAALSSLNVKTDHFHGDLFGFDDANSGEPKRVERGRRVIQRRRRPANGSKNQGRL
jgi:hypothetical protein